MKSKKVLIISLIISLLLGLFIWDLGIISVGSKLCYHKSFWSLFFKELLFMIVIVVIFYILVFLYGNIRWLNIFLVFAIVYGFFKSNYELFSKCSIIKIISHTYDFLIVSILVSYFIVLKFQKDTEKNDFLDTKNQI